MPFGIDYLRKHLKENFNGVFEREVSEDEAQFIFSFGKFNLVVKVNNKRNYVVCYIPSIIHIKPKHKAAVLEKVMELNYQMILGGYGYDPQDGELRFEICQATEGFIEPWEAYEPLLKRMIGVTIHVARDNGEALEEMNFTGKWPEAEGDGSEAKEEGETAQYDSMCLPILQGEVRPAAIPQATLGQFLDFIIKVSINSGRNRLEDYPDDWQALLRERMEGGSGTEI